MQHLFVIPLAAFLRREPIDFPRLSSPKIVALMHADADTRVTADALDGELEALMRRVTSCCDPSLSAMCYLLCLTGARCRELARLRRRQIRVDISGKKRAKLIIQFRITKVRRSRWLRITIPFAFSLFGVFPDAAILSYLSEGPRDQRLLRTFTMRAASTDVLQSTAWSGPSL